MPAPKLVKTKIRLYDVDTNGFKFLAFPAGMELPAAEYRRLVRQNGLAPAERPEPVEDEAPEPPAPPPAFADLSRAQLMVEAKMRGLKVSTRMTKAELVELCEKAAS